MYFYIAKIEILEITISSFILIRNHMLKSLFLILEGGRVNSNRNENVNYKNNVNNLYYHLPMTDDSHPFSFW